MASQKGVSLDHIKIPELEGALKIPHFRAGLIGNTSLFLFLLHDYTFPKGKHCAIKKNQSSMHFYVTALLQMKAVHKANFSMDINQACSPVVGHLLRLGLRKPRCVSDRFIHSCCEH